MSNPDWNFEPKDNECFICANEGREECECTDRHERDTLDE